MSRHGTYTQRDGSPAVRFERDLPHPRDAGLVTVRPDAQRRIYAVDPQPLAELHEWLARYRRLWDDRLDALERRLDETEGT